MFRTILKVIYFAFAFFAAMVGYMVTYQSNIYNVLSDRAQGYLENEEYAQIARMFGGISNSKARIDGSRDEYKNDKVRIQLFEGTTEANYTYYVKELNDKNKEEDVIKSYHAYDKSYYLYMFNVNFTTKNIADSDKELINKTGVSFYNEAGQEYNYLFTNSGSINSKTFKDKPKDKYEAVLNGTRDFNSFAKSWGFYSVIIDETLIEAVQNSLDKERNDATSSPIVAFNITDNEGKKIYNDNISFNFDFKANAESTFFDDTQILYDEYDKLMPLYDKHKNGEISKDEYKKAYDTFNANIKPFDDKMKNGGFPDYLQSFTQKELVPGWVMWKTMGEIALFAILVFIIYMLLFNFGKVANLCKKLWSKITGKKPSNGGKSNNKHSKGQQVEMRVKPEAMKKPEEITLNTAEIIDANLEEEIPASEPINKEAIVEPTLEEPSEVEDTEIKDAEFSDPKNDDLK